MPKTCCWTSPFLACRGMETQTLNILCLHKHFAILLFLTPNLLLLFKPIIPSASLFVNSMISITPTWIPMPNISTFCFPTSHKPDKLVDTYIWQVKVIRDSDPHVVTARDNMEPEAATFQTQCGRCGWLQAAHPHNWKNTVLPACHYLRVILVQKGLPWPWQCLPPVPPIIAVFSVASTMRELPRSDPLRPI